MTWLKRVAAAVLLAVVVQGAATAQGLVSFPRSTVEIVTQGGARHSFAVEVATTPQQLAQGLMFRKSMAADAGMLFDFGEVRAVSMWMKNTLIPLDMLFLAPDGKVMGIRARAVPGSLETIDSPGTVKGVLELNGGTADRLGLKAGDRLVHPLFAR